tara:strand:+ start:880 stop:1374 length:495 start_codon:yes stop_codon:yes gene_type:complete
MLDPMAPVFDAPVPGEAMTAELGARPWQQPAQYTTVEEALDFYLPRLESDEVTDQLLDVLEMGIPVTTIANTMQLGNVMEGRHSVDVGMLLLPVLVELIMLIGDKAGVKYTSGLEEGTEMRSTLIDLAVSKFNSEDDKEEEEEVETKEEEVEEPLVSGLMSRNN